MYSLIGATLQARRQAIEENRACYVVEMASEIAADLLDSPSLLPAIAAGERPSNADRTDRYDPVTYHCVTGFQAALWRSDGLAMELVRVASPDGGLAAVGDQAEAWRGIQARHGETAATYAAKRAALMARGTWEAVMPQLEAAYARARRADAAGLR